jgi:hypothetical protein
MGGIIFWLNSDGTHGLIAAKVDQGTSINWSTLTASTVVSGASGDGIGGGFMNTTLIISREAALVPPLGAIGSFAARACGTYTIQSDGTTPCTTPGADQEQCYSDWYLPSKFELNQLYLRGPAGACPNLGGFANVLYWSSTEGSGLLSGILTAWAQNFSTGIGAGIQQLQPKIPLLVTHNVRCIRAF